MSEHHHLYRPDPQNPGQERCLATWGPCDAPTRQAPAPAQRGSPTSVEAARLIEPVLGRFERMVLEHIRSSGGSTDQEGINATALDPSTYRPRRVKLVDLGLVRDSGGTRPTKAGRHAVVWVEVIHNPSDLSTTFEELSTVRPQSGEVSE